MLSFFKEYKTFAIVFGVISVIIIAIIYNTLNVYQPLPIYQPNMVSTELVDSTIQYKKKYHKIADFSFTNQNGKTVTQKDYENKIYVADFFFTTCPTICPIMTKNMTSIQKEILNDDDVMLLSHSVTPEIDTVAQLKRYAIAKGVDDTKWNLVTGDKKEIYKMARKSYLAVKDNGDGGPFDMVHTENFMLIDKKRQIRGFYDGTKPEDIKKLLNDISHLRKEYNN
ncbi:SCO family protein [Seonamhaeicola sp. ML3]|uniref:SCO family protein n=1 Tax=Seonamhaeicola sp. ML3 TaxID=2937786 RepID=UPI0020109590|nr:SCO family protein [Seonamhaeicola sp. ML3]